MVEGQDQVEQRALAELEAQLPAERQRILLVELDKMVDSQAMGVLQSLD
jgi:hypothetical protein